MLLVDDNVFNIKTMQSLLKLKYSIMPVVAMNGEEALKKVEERLKECKDGEQPFKLILMDCNMPIMDGFKASKLILAACQKAQCELPLIIALTAFDNAEVEQQCKNIGINQFIVKPISPTRLGECLQSVGLV